MYETLGMDFPTALILDMNLGIFTESLLTDD